MPYDAEKASDVSSMKEKLDKTYSGVDDTAARQAIHVWNGVMDSDGDEGPAWAAVYKAMNDRGLGKKGKTAADVALRDFVEEQKAVIKRFPSVRKLPREALQVVYNQMERQLRGADDPVDYARGIDGVARDYPAMANGTDPYLVTTRQRHYGKLTDEELRLIGKALDDIVEHFEKAQRGWEDWERAYWSRAASLYGGTYVMTGRTFQNKDLIRSIFGPALEWDGPLKRWLGYGGGNGMDRNMWTLRRSGVKVQYLPGIRLKPGQAIPDKFNKGASRVAERFLMASAASRVAQRHLLAAAPTLKLLADTIARMAVVEQTEDNYTQKVIEPKKAEAIFKRWLAHAVKEGAKYAEITLGPLKNESWNRWSVTATVRDTFKSGSKTAPWVSWEGSDKLYITVERDFDHWDVSITDRNGRIVFDSDSIPKAIPSQVILALVMDRPRFVSTRVWQEENDHREERVDDWASDVTPWD